WHVARVADIALAQAAYQLSEKARIWLPGMSESEARGLPIEPMSKVGTIGPYHMDVNGKTPSGGIRGPFLVSSLKAARLASYRVLWAQDADRERAMAFEEDSEKTPIKGKDEDEEKLVAKKVKAVAATASHSHFNRDFRSQIGPGSRGRNDTSSKSP